MAKQQAARKSKKYVFFYGFGKKHTEGDRTMKHVLGGKGANLAEMANANLPVPPGFALPVRKGLRTALSLATSRRRRFRGVHFLWRGGWSRCR